MEGNSQSKLCYCCSEETKSNSFRVTKTRHFPSIIIGLSIFQISSVYKFLNRMPLTCFFEILPFSLPQFQGHLTKIILEIKPKECCCGSSSYSPTEESSIYPVWGKLTRDDMQTIIVYYILLKKDKIEYKVNKWMYIRHNERDKLRAWPSPLINAHKNVDWPDIK